MKSLLFTLILSVCLFIGTFSIYLNKIETEEVLMEGGGEINDSSPPCLLMYDAIERYAEEYRIPKRFAYGIAFKETRYQGPFHWKYDPERISSAGALGPMQIMPSTARLMWKGKKISDRMIMSDLDFNVMTSMKLLRHLYDRYGDWKIVFGCYNTGKPLVNQYAIDVFNFNFQGNGYKFIGAREQAQLLH